MYALLIESVFECKCLSGVCLSRLSVSVQKGISSEDVKMELMKEFSLEQKVST